MMSKNRNRRCVFAVGVDIGQKHVIFELLFIEGKKYCEGKWDGIDEKMEVKLGDRLTYLL